MGDRATVQADVPRIKGEIMREFRGKRVDNGEWVYGDVHWNTDCSKCHIHERSERIFESHTIIPESVGQSTGLKDKNVFEGDEVRWLYIAQEPDTGATNEVEATGVVIFHNGCFAIDSEDDGWTSKPCLHYIATFTSFEVIGNIHEHKDLLDTKAE